MSRDNIDVDALQQDLEEFGRQQRQRGWFRRNWLWFVPMLLLAVIVVGGAATYWAMILRIYHLEVCQSAMQTIRADKGMQAALGQPIQPVYWPSKETVPSQGEDITSWSIEGPKDRVRVHAKVRQAMGKWEIVTLDVELKGKKVSLSVAGDNEAPPADFSTPKAGTNKPEANAPPPEINLPTPPADEPGK
jgi:hypothetical protein